MKLYLQSLFKYRNLLMNLIERDIKVKYRRSVLGVLWSVLNPLMMMLVMSIVFSKLFRFDVPNYPVYYLTGSLLFGFYSESTTGAMGSVLNAAALIKKVYIPKYIFPLEKVMFAFVNLLFSLIALVVMLLLYRIPITAYVLLAWFPLLCMFVFSVGVGLILSCYTVFFRDIAHLYSVFVTAVMFLTPTFYPESVMLENDLGWVLSYNPLFQNISYFRKVVLYGAMPTLQNHLVCIGSALLMLLIGVWVFRKNQDKFILHI